MRRAKKEPSGNFQKPGEGRELDEDEPGVLSGGVLAGGAGEFVPSGLEATEPPRDETSHDVNDLKSPLAGAKSWTSRVGRRPTKAWGCPQEQ